MGKHAEWRRIAKKFRRKRIRQRLAQERDHAKVKAQRRREASPTYQRWLQQQEQEELFQAEEEARLAAERETQWLQAEAEAQMQWQELQKKLEKIREERKKQNARIKLEWEKEEKKLRELREQKEKEAEVERLEQERLQNEIEIFLENGGSTPEQLKGDMETNPGKTVCPFFKKTASCRFRDSCSRNHIRPRVSRIVLIPGFYSHYSLEQTENEHGNDMNLEFDSKELYGHFKDFFYDVVPELETYGRVVNFKVCCNHELHLRGNVYVEYSETREAVKCYRGLNGRYYGGKQLSAQFCSIDFWKLAICGEFFRKTCPKGNLCNFLHVFINPDRLFPHNEKSERHITKPHHSCVDDRRSWRWSESPERDYYREKVSDDGERRDFTKRSSNRSTKDNSPVYRNGSSHKSLNRSRYRSPKSSRHRSRSRKRAKRRSRSRSISRSSRRHSKRSRRRSSESS